MNFSRPHIWETQDSVEVQKRRPWNQKEKERRRGRPLQEQLEKEKPFNCCAGRLHPSPWSPCRCWVCWWVVTCWLMAQLMNYRLQLALASDLQVGALPKSGLLPWPQNVVQMHVAWGDGWNISHQRCEVCRVPTHRQCRSVQLQVGYSTFLQQAYKARQEGGHCYSLYSADWENGAQVN